MQLGAAYASAENWPQAISCLERALVLGGQYDHPLTGTALLELGLIAMAMGDTNSAGRYFEETTYSAAIFGDVTLLEEAFRYGSMNHLVSSQKGIYPPLVTAAAWAKTKGFRQLYSSLLLMTAENFAVQGDRQRAAALLTEARTNIARRDMANGVLGARLNHLTSLVLYQNGDVADGDQMLAAALTFEKLGSLWVFQLGLADQMFLNGEITDRVALLLYEQLLRDPTPADWSTSPLESLAILTVPHPGPYEHWFEIVIKRSKDNHEQAIEIADRARRHRFFSSLPLGGRLLGLALDSGRSQRITQRPGAPAEARIALALSGLRRAGSASQKTAGHAGGAPAGGTSPGRRAGTSGRIGQPGLDRQATGSAVAADRRAARIGRHDLSADALRP